LGMGSLAARPPGVIQELSVVETMA
jgi:hypothetical protein